MNVGIFFLCLKIFFGSPHFLRAKIMSCDGLVQYRSKGGMN